MQTRVFLTGRVASTKPLLGHSHVRAYYLIKYHILSSTTHFLLKSSCKYGLTLLQSFHFLQPNSCNPRSPEFPCYSLAALTPCQGLCFEQFPCIRPHLFLALKPDLLVLDVFLQGPSVPKTNNSYCLLSIYYVLYMHYLINLTTICNYPNFQKRKLAQRELAPCLKSYRQYLNQDSNVVLTISINS